MKKVDWSKAPEGATHYNKDCDNPWLKETPPSFFDEYNEVWVKYNSVTRAEEHLSNAAKRPQEWDGSGAPPVGTVCEYSLDGDVWFNCISTYVLSGSGDCFVAWCDHLGIEQYLTLSSDRYKLQLRKIKTPEQIAAETRSCAIDEMVDLAIGYSAIFKDAMAKLYDAGYRKTE